MNRIFILVWAGLEVLTLSASNPACAAAESPLVAPPESSAGAAGDAPQWHALHLKNVQPHVMAWYIDPGHNAEPQEFVQSLKNMAMSEPSAGKKPLPAPDSILNLPEGVTSVVPADSQNTLLVMGNAEGTRRVRQIAKLLDKPIRQVGIEAQAVELTPEDLKGLHMELTPSDHFSIGYLRDDSHARLEELLRQKKARLISAPRVTAVNNLTARVVTATSTPAVVGARDAAGQFKPVFDSSQKRNEGRLAVTSESGLTVNPTVNYDNTVTLLLRQSKTLQLTVGAQQTGESFPLRTLEAATTIVNMQDKSTVALVGLTTSMFSTGEPHAIDGKEQISTPRNVVLFVTVCVRPMTEEQLAEEQPAEEKLAGR